MKYIKTTMLIVFGVLLCACSSVAVDITKTGAGYYEPTDPNKVEILMTVPRKPYVELGTVTTRGFSAREEAKMHNAIRAKAAPLGATSVIIQSQGMIPQSFGAAERWVTGVAIRYE